MHHKSVCILLYVYTLTQGDTLENVSKELDCIMSTGYFELIVQPKRSSKSKVLLHYQPFKELYRRKHMHRETYEGESIDSNASNTPPGSFRNKSCLPEVWNSEQINEFVRKLGFLEAQKVEQPVKRFQQLNQVCLCVHNYLIQNSPAVK